MTSFSVEPTAAAAPAAPTAGSPANGAHPVDVRFFAGAAEAAGADALTVDLATGATLSDLRAVLVDQRPALARVLDVSSLLLDARPVTPGTDPVLADGVRVDVLPPFAGG